MANPQPNEIWRNTETGALITIVQNDGDYVVVHGKAFRTQRNPKGERLVNLDHFGTRYVKQAKK